MMATFVFVLLVIAGIVLAVIALFIAASIHAMRVPFEIDRGKPAKQSPIDPVSVSGITRDSAMKAIIKCGRIPPALPKRFETAGYVDCRTLNGLYGGNLGCTVSCLGLGTCAAFCPSDAIVFRDGLAYVNDACNGCGACVDACPKRLFSLVPVTLKDGYDCAARGTRDASCDCPVARADCRIELSAFPESGFKLLSRWGILKPKSR